MIVDPHDSRTPPTLARYAAERERRLARAVAAIRGDPRLLAGWLTGSFGRGEADGLSDLDLTVVVADSASDLLCARPRPLTAGTTPGRLALVAAAGEPVVIHENHVNAPAGGTFTHVLYAGAGVAIDWTLVPQSAACRPEASTLLLDKVGIPLAEPAPTEDREERTARAAERSAFFWMVALPAAKAALRDEPVAFHRLLELLHDALAEVERLLRGDPARYRRRSGARLAPTFAEQAAALRALCARMAQLGSELDELGAAALDPPLTAIDALLTAGPPPDAKKRGESGGQTRENGRR